MKNPSIYIISKKINKITVDYAKENYGNREIYIVTTRNEKSIWENLNFDSVKIIDENEILDKKIFETKMKDLDNIGWFYQQFLKYYTVLYANDDNIHIIDGDSIVNPELSKLGILVTTGKSTYKKYSLFSKIVLNYDNEKYSFVTNQMVFNKDKLNKMLTEIEKNNNKSWMDVFICVMKKNSEAIFSEYQLYGNYIQATEGANPIKVKVFRRMDCLKINLRDALNKYEIIAYEPHHRTGIMRVMRAKIYYKLGVSLG